MRAQAQAGWAGQLPEIDAGLSREWLDSLDEVVDIHGANTARLILARLLRRAGERDVGMPTTVSTPYLNSISPGDEPVYPGDVEVEARIEAVVRWNTVAMVTRANVRSEGIGGHLSTPASVPDQVAKWVPGHLSTLGTDGYGRSDSRAALRRHFETDTAHVVVAVLAALADTDDAKPEEVADAIAHYGIDPDAVEPRQA